MNDDAKTFAARRGRIAEWLKERGIAAAVFGRGLGLCSLFGSSGFTRLRPDVYRLSFALKNQSRTPVALPALQLHAQNGFGTRRKLGSHVLLAAAQYEGAHAL